MYLNEATLLNNLRIRYKKDLIYVSIHTVIVCVCVCVCAHARAHVCTCVRACVCIFVHTTICTYVIRICTYMVNTLKYCNTIYFVFTTDLCC